MYPSEIINILKVKYLIYNFSDILSHPNIYFYIKIMKYTFGSMSYKLAQLLKAFETCIERLYIAFLYVVLFVSMFLYWNEKKVQKSKTVIKKFIYKKSVWDIETSKSYPFKYGWLGGSKAFETLRQVLRQTYILC